MELVNKKRCVIVGAAKIDDGEMLKKNIFYDDYVIGADAGYRRLLDLGITPDLIVGDFDSSDTPEVDVEVIILNPIKDCTDTEFAVEKAVEKGFTEILILGATGGRLDHTFANFALLGDFKQKGININVLDEKHKIYALKDESHTVQKNNRYLSVFALGSYAEVTLEGVFYPLDKYRLSPFSSLGVSNEITEPTAKITVTDGTLLVMEVSKENF